MTRASLVIVWALALIGQPWSGQAQPFNIFEAIGSGANAIGGAVVGSAKAVVGAVSAVAVGGAKVVGGAVGNIFNTLGHLGQGAVQNLRGLAQGIASAAEKIIQGAAHNVEQAVNQLLQTVSPCFDGKIDLNAIRDKAFGLAIGCVQERMVKAYGIINNAAEAVKQVITIDTDVTAACGEGVDGLECAAAKLAPEATEIPSKLLETVTSTVSLAQDLVQGVQNDLPNCIQNKAKEAVSEAVTAAKGIAQCEAAKVLDAANNLG